jgi:hypothetical protein
MKPSSLRPGDRVRRVSGVGMKLSRVLTFIRIERQLGRKTVVLQCDDYRGQAGPDDQGLCTVSLGELARHFEVAA